MLSLSKSLDVKNIYKKLKNVCFNFDGFYPFKDSQVTVGGVKNACLRTKGINLWQGLTPAVFLSLKIFKNLFLL